MKKKIFVKPEIRQLAMRGDSILTISNLNAGKTTTGQYAKPAVGTPFNSQSAAGTSRLDF